MSSGEEITYQLQNKNQQYIIRVQKADHSE